MARTGQAGRLVSRAGEILALEILVGYPQAVFPMAEDQDDLGYSWYEPQMRGIVPLEGFHVSRSLARYVRQNAERLQFAYNLNFEAVIDGCAARETTWINQTIRDAFTILRDRQMAHSAEIYCDGKLMGGVYGLALGGAFFGESMFSAAPNGSKLALGAMVNDLRERGFALYDTQFITEHLASLGGEEITAEEYQERLDAALEIEPKPIPTGLLPFSQWFLQQDPQQDHQ